MMMNKHVIAYVPAIHWGYMDLFNRHASRSSSLFLLSGDALEGFPKEIRALDPSVAKDIVSGMGIFGYVGTADLEAITEMAKREAAEFIFANEAVSKAVMKLVSDNCVSGSTLVLDDVFLQWDASSVTTDSNVIFDRESDDHLDRHFMDLANSLACRSSDWWRRVGSVITKDGDVIYASYNHHLPTEHAPYINGDPRDFVEAGTMREIYSSIHAEQDALMQAAKGVVSLKGAHIYVSSFPCAVCAKLIAMSGISKVFFESGYSALDGQTVLSAFGVEIVRVNKASV